MTTNGNIPQYIQGVNFIYVLHMCSLDYIHISGVLIEALGTY